MTVEVDGLPSMLPSKLCRFRHQRLLCGAPNRLLHTHMIADI
jgi:hypothetical protein